MKTVFTANRTRKALSLDDLDRIVGGGSLTVDGITFTEEEFNKQMWAYADMFGYETAIAMFKAYTGMVDLPFAWESYAKQHGGDEQTRMLLICEAFWTENKHGDL